MVQLVAVVVVIVVVLVSSGANGSGTSGTDKKRNMLLPLPPVIPLLLPHTTTTNQADFSTIMPFLTGCRSRASTEDPTSFCLKEN